MLTTPILFFFNALANWVLIVKPITITPRAELLPPIVRLFWPGAAQPFAGRRRADKLCRKIGVYCARSGVGLEHIDVELAEKRGIKVIPSPEGSRDTVAEHAIGMLLMLMNNLGLADRQIRDGQWVRAANRGIEIKGKTIGIIGYGNMGSAFAQKIRGFGARLIAYDKFKTHYADELVEEVELEQIWAEADIVTLHIPYLPENYHFVDHTFLQRFQKKHFSDQHCPRDGVEHG